MKTLLQYLKYSYFLWLKSLALHSCVTVLIHKLHELMLTQFDLWQIQEKPRHSTFCGQAQERTEPEFGFAAEAC